MKQFFSSFSSLRILVGFFYQVHNLFNLFVLKFQLLESSESHPTFQNFLKDTTKKKGLSLCLI